MGKTVNQQLREAGMRTTMWTEQQDVIEALKIANKEKDALNAGLFEDIKELKKRCVRYEKLIHRLFVKYQALRDEKERRGIQ